MYIIKIKDDCKKLEEIFFQMCKLNELNKDYYKSNKLKYNNNEFDMIPGTCNEKSVYFLSLCIRHKALH